MEILGPKETGFVVVDDLLNFTLDGEGEEEEETAIFKGASASSSSLESSNPATSAFSRQTQTGSFPEFAEEELEWLSNKDAFPAVETCFGILSDNPELVLSHHSPVSVLQNNSSSSSNTSNGGSIASCCDSLKVPTNYPVRARSKRRRRRRSGFADLPSQHCLWSTQANAKSKQELSSFLLPPLSTAASNGAGMGRRCLHCHADKTPQWRAGPMGPKTLCNACGVRFKSGRLLPEYRPASSPTFSSALHSNSHRKVVEMRKQKLGQGGGGDEIAVNVGCGYNRLG